MKYVLFVLVILAVILVFVGVMLLIAKGAGKVDRAVNKHKKKDQL